MLLFLSDLRIYALFSTTSSDFGWPIQTFVGPLCPKKSEFGPSPANSDPNWGHCLVPQPYVKGYLFTRIHDSRISPAIWDIPTFLFSKKARSLTLTVCRCGKIYPTKLSLQWKSQLSQLITFLNILSHI